MILFKIKRICISLSLVFHLSIFVCGQEILLEPVESGLSLFSDISVSKVRLLSETEETLNLEMSYEIKNDKSYIVASQVLTPTRVLLNEVTTQRQKLSRQSGTLDLRFDLKPNLNLRKYDKPYLDSRYIKIIFSETSENDDSWSDILDVFGEDNPLGDALGEAFLFKHNRQWRIGGGSGMVIKVPITPIGNASIIKQ